MNEKCMKCNHKIACRRTARACGYFQGIDMRMQDYHTNLRSWE